MVGLPTVAGAQAVATNPSAEVPRMDLAVGYSYIRANAPPGGCPCFSVNGGFVSANINFSRFLGITGEMTGGRGSNVSSLGQNLNLITFMGGPRVSFTGHRIVPFGQVLFGGAHASDSYFPNASSYTTSETKWAFSAGGGIDYNLTRRFSIRIPEVQFLRTNFNNAANNQQNQLMIGAGLVVKFFGFGREHHAVEAPPAPSASLDLSCTTNKVVVQPGQKLEVIGSATSNEARSDVIYSWTTTAGQIEGSGSHVMLNTDGVPPGTYRVAGRASLSAPSKVYANCETVFRIAEATQPPPPPPAPNPNRADEEKSFHDNVPDVYFDYDKYDIRPDTAAGIAHAAEYLKAHPSLGVLIGGYSDERGTIAYNLALGEKRATAVRDALVAAGVEASRITVISYGKGAQVCTAGTENCWQQNRRAAFMIRP